MLSYDCLIWCWCAGGSMSRNVLGNSAGAAAISPPTLGVNSMGTLAGDCLQAMTMTTKACFAIMLRCVQCKKPFKGCCLQASACVMYNRSLHQSVIHKIDYISSITRSDWQNTMCNHLRLTTNSMLCLLVSTSVCHLHALVVSSPTGTHNHCW